MTIRGVIYYPSVEAVTTATFPSRRLLMMLLLELILLLMLVRFLMSDNDLNVVHIVVSADSVHNKIGIRCMMIRHLSG